MHKNWYKKRQYKYKTQKHTENHTNLRKLYKLKRTTGRKEFFLQIMSALSSFSKEKTMRFITRPHRSTTYVYVAYYYRPSSVVCRSVCPSVRRSVKLVSPAKTAAPIEMQFGLRTRVSPRNHVLDGGPDPPMERGNFEGGKGRPIVKYRDSLRSSMYKRLN